MNLNNMLKDASLSNLEWLADPTTIEPLDKDNNKKDDLQIEWGMDVMDGIDLEEQDEGKITEQLGLTVPEKNPARPDRVQVDVIRYASICMMQGIMGKRLVARLSEKFSNEILKKAVPELKQLLAFEGIVGCIAVDARPFASCKEALKFAAKSPYKKFIKYIVGCKCGTHHQIAMESGKAASDISVTGNALDDFFSSEVLGVNTKPFCKETMKPLLAGKGDLDDTEEDETFIDLVTTGNLTEKEVAAIRSEKKSSFDKIRSAFILIDKKSHIKAPEIAVKANDYKFNTDMEVNVGKKFVAETIDVDPVNHEVDQAISIAADGRKESIKVSGKAAAMDFEVSEGKKVADLDVDPIDHQIALVADLAGESVNSSLNVERGNGQIAGFEVNPVKKAQAQLEVDPVDHLLDKEVNIANENNFENQEVDSLVAEYEALDIQKEAKVQKSLEIDKLMASVEVEFGSVDGMDIGEIQQASANIENNEITFGEILAGEIDVDGKGAMAELEISEEQEELKIDASGIIEKEFIGSDEFDLDEKKEAAKQDIDMKPDFRLE